MSALLEREDEVARLDALLVRARAGRGGVAAIEGPAGIGKTRLGQEACERAAASGLTVLSARGSELESEFGFGAVRQLFEPVLGAGEEERRRELLEGAALLAAPALGLAEVRAAGADARFTAVHGLYWLTSNLAGERPLLLWVDDLQWVDEPSLRFLAYLARRLSGLPAALVVARRPVLPGEGRRLGAAITGERGATLLRPAPLSAAAVGAVAEERLGAPADSGFAETCRQITGGNALLVEEILTELEEQAVHPDAAAARRLGGAGLERVGRRVARRLDALPDGARELAEAVAVLGDGASLEVAGALAGLAGEAAVEAAEALAAADILADDASPRFSHPVVRSAVSGRLGPIAGAAAHARAARLLAERGAPAAVLATHLLSAPPAGDAWVVATLRRAAGDATAQGEPGLAARRLRRALAEPPETELRATLLLELGRAELAAGRAEGADRLREALGLTEGREARARIALQLSTALAERLEWSAAAEVAGTALAELDDAGSEAGLMLQAVRADCARMDLTIEGDDVDRIRTLAGRLGGFTPGERRVLATAAVLAPADTAADHAAAAELLLRSMGQGAPPGGRPQTGIVSNLIRAGRLDRAEEVVERFLDEAREGGLVHRHALMISMRGWVELERGELAAALDDLRGALDLSEDVGTPPGATATMLALVLAEHGEPDEAGRLIEAHDLEGELPEQQVMNLALFFRARVRLAQGNSDDALADALEVGRRYERWAIRRAVPAWRSLAAPLLAARGAHEEALALAEEELLLARRWDTPLALGLALRGLGAVSADPERLAASAAELERSPAKLELARGWVELGAALRRVGRRSDARGPLRAGLDLAHRCGARLLSEHARTELLATGARPRRLALSGSEALTPSERRVADLAASGLSNRQIAQDLFVTIATVETHLRHSFQKLRVSSREELADALAESSG